MFGEITWTQGLSSLLVGSAVDAFSKCYGSSGYTGKCFAALNIVLIGWFLKLISFFVNNFDRVLEVCFTSRMWGTIIGLF
jgi:hypothetical protein